MAPGIALLVTGAFLWSSRGPIASAKGSLPGWGAALLIGVAQAFALVPGISRSGATVVAALWLGIEAREAAAFSFLMAVPAIAGAAVLQVPDLTSVTGPGWGVLLLGGISRGRNRCLGDPHLRGRARASLVSSVRAVLLGGRCPLPRVSGSAVSRDALTHWHGEPVATWCALWGVPAFEAYESIGSTNDRAKELAAEPRNTFAVVIAAEQTDGRGRRGARWHSPSGTGLWMSVVLPNPSAALHLPLLVGLAAAEAIQDAHGPFG